MNKNEPLGLPRGSVRAILALLVTGATIAVTVIRGEIPTDLVPLASVVVTYYFVSRDTAPPAVAADEDLPEPHFGDGA